MTQSEWVVQPLGDRAFLLARAKEEGPPGATAAAARRIRALGPPWLREVVPAYRSIAVHLRPFAIEPSRAAEELLRDLRSFQGTDDGTEKKVVEIPVVYGGEDGPDLAASAARSGMTEESFALAHAEAEYDVAMIGFAPGFPYLSGLPGRLAQPRRQTPRLRVPAGSVGIAGGQTGVYPVASPGGWQIIGRTAARLFRPEEREPFLLGPGDRVKFVPVASLDVSEDERMQPAAETGKRGGPRREPALTVLKPGLLTTVQDAGRPGWQAYGVSVGGAMDERARRTANALVGNADDAAALEFTMIGAAFAVERPILIAVSGAGIEATVDGEPVPSNRPIAIRAGATLAFGRAREGCRAYMAIAGGIDVPRVLGSRSADPRAGIGGGSGAALVRGERLACGEPTAQSLVLSDALHRDARKSGRSWSTVPWQASAVNAAPERGKAATVRIVPGAEWEQFGEEARRALLGSAYRVAAASDRMGVRLAGPALARLESSELASHGVAPGTIQVPPDGQPIVLAAGCQPTGGYPKIAHVASADFPLLAQLVPGDAVRFERIDPAEAAAAALAAEQDLAILKAGVFARVRALSTEGA